MENVVNDGVCLAFKKVLKLKYEIHNKKENAQQKIKTIKNGFRNVAIPKTTYESKTKSANIFCGEAGEPGVCVHAFLSKM